MFHADSRLSMGSGWCRGMSATVRVGSQEMLFTWEVTTVTTVTAATPFGVFLFLKADTQFQTIDLPTLRGHLREISGVFLRSCPLVN